MANQTQQEKELELMDLIISQEESISYIAEEDEYSANDGILSKGDRKYLTEIKIRKNYTESSVKNFGGQILEYKKLLGCSKKWDNTFQKSLIYIVQFQDIITVYKIPFKLLNNNDVWTNGSYSATTEFSNSDILSKKVLNLKESYVVSRFYNEVEDYSCYTSEDEDLDSLCDLED